MKRILFQGDSITDAKRLRDNENYKGMGYPTFVSARLGFDCPNDYEFFNRGISGNRIVDIYARMKMDIVNLKPDYLSILVGVNDVWHEINDDEMFRNGVSAEKFYKVYSILIDELKTELRNLKIMILEPFVLKQSGTEANWEYFRPEVEKRAEMAKRVAEENDLVFVPLLKEFDEATKIAPAEHWTIEGVHPTPAGHELIARAWMKGFEKLK